MKTLVVKDLSMTEKMEPRAMARVHGGLVLNPQPYNPYFPLPLPFEFPQLPALPFYPAGRPDPLAF